MAELVVDDCKTRAIARQHDVAAQLAALDSARVAHELPKADVAVHTNGDELDEVGAARLDTAANSRVAREQRAAGKDDHVPPDVGSEELTTTGDVQRPAQLDIGASRRAVHVSLAAFAFSALVVVLVLCRGAMTLKQDRRHDSGK